MASCVLSREVVTRETDKRATQRRRSHPLLAMRRASSIVSTLAVSASARVSRIHIGESLASGILHDVAAGNSFSGPGRLEAAGCVKVAAAVLSSCWER